MQLTKRQKELFQLDKYVLVDTIILLENKILSVKDEVKFLNNERLLNEESFKAELQNRCDELEMERSARCAAENACITAQEEIDGFNKDVDEISGLDNDTFLHALQEKIDKFRSESLASREKVIEEGENGSL